MLQANEGISGWKFFHPTHCNKVGSSPLFLTGCVNAREPWAKCIHLPNVGFDSLPLHLYIIPRILGAPGDYIDF